MVVFFLFLVVFSFFIDSSMVSYIDVIPGFQPIEIIWSLGLICDSFFIDSETAFSEDQPVGFLETMKVGHTNQPVEIFLVALRLPPCFSRNVCFFLMFFLVVATLM